MGNKMMSRYWWVMLLRGILAVVFALLAFFWTGLTLEVLVLLFAIFAIGEGVFAIGASIEASKHHEKWGTFLLEGVLGIIAGVIIISWPGISVAIFVYLIALWALITGLVEILVGGTVEITPTAKSMIILVGVLSLILGVVMLAYPAATITILIWLLGVYALIAGIAMIIFSVQLKSLK